MTKQTQANRPAVKQVATRMKDGTIVGYITVYWCQSMERYVTIPE